MRIKIKINLEKGGGRGGRENFRKNEENLRAGLSVNCCRHLMVMVVPDPDPKVLV